MTRDPSPVYQHLRALNDPNGNPQRLYVVYEWIIPDEKYRQPEHWATVAVWDEGYIGLPDALRDMPSLPSIDISRSDYHERIRAARERGILKGI